MLKRKLMNNLNNQIINDPCAGPTLTVGCMFDRISSLPEPQYIYRGIVYPSLGVVFGPAKSGKTIFSENLLLSLAAGREIYLGDKIYSPSNRVLIVSLEEFYRNRTARNKKQIESFTERFQLDPSWSDEVYIVDDTFPRYIHSDKDWQLLEREIARIMPSVVVIDSLTRLTTESIEDSAVATRIMKKLREMTHKFGITVIVIHHSQKLENKPITIASLAGSRVVGQELDFMIGVNRTYNNIRYLKDVAYRYASDDTDQVLKFRINDSQIIESAGFCTEAELFASGNGGQMNDSDALVLQYLIEKTGNDESVIVLTADLYQYFIDSQILTRPTLHAALNRLVSAGAIEKVAKGEYRIRVAS
jgi:archaellum biogenesis ATPase FlaH